MQYIYGAQCPILGPAVAQLHALQAIPVGVDGGGSPDGLQPAFLTDWCWALGDIPQKHSRLYQPQNVGQGLLPAVRARTPYVSHQTLDSSSIQKLNDGLGPQTTQVTTASLQKPSAYPRVMEIYFFHPFPSLPKWLFLAKCLTRHQRGAREKRLPPRGAAQGFKYTLEGGWV